MTMENPNIETGLVILGLTVPVDGACKERKLFPHLCLWPAEKCLPSHLGSELHNSAKPDHKVWMPMHTRMKAKIRARASEPVSPNAP
jgi:hypothetical protein